MAQNHVLLDVVLDLQETGNEVTAEFVINDINEVSDEKLTIELSVHLTLTWEEPRLVLLGT